MSSFFGIFRKDGAPLDESDLRAMAWAMRRRGPDGTNFWLRGNVGFGHAMMWTTPEALHEHPPVVSPDGHCVLSADVRLDNREQLLSTLRSYLRAAQRPAAEIGDHELILAAYEKWGEECPRHFLGDFAFAIWDSKRSCVFCARDHFGCKPFHYHDSDRLFVFASEVKGVLAVSDVPRRINEPRIADFLVEELEGIDKTSTFYRDIFRLPPAMTMVVNQPGKRQRRYWQLDPTRAIKLKSQEEYTEAFLDIFTEAVACRLRSHKPPASMLSGGIDSSAIVAVGRQLRRRMSGEPLHTISAVSDGLETCIETQAIDAVIAQGDVIPHRIDPSQLRDVRASLDHFASHCDDPFSLAGVGVVFTTNCVARREGINVLLDGVDADLAISHGDIYLAYLLKAGRWRTALSEALSLSRNRYRHTVSLSRLLQRSVRTAFIPFGIRKCLHSLRQRQRLKEALGLCGVNSEFAREVRLAERFTQYDAHLRAPLPESLRHLQAIMLDKAFLTVALERYDRLASSQSVEARHPFLDVRLVEFCLALPWQQRIRNGYSKAILRTAMNGLLPEVVRWRVGGWEHLGSKFNSAWMELRAAAMQRAMGHMAETLENYLNPTLFRSALSRGKSAAAPWAFPETLSLAGNLAFWLETQAKVHQQYQFFP